MILFISFPTFSSICLLIRFFSTNSVFNFFFLLQYFSSFPVHFPKQKVLPPNFPLDPLYFQLSHYFVSSSPSAISFVLTAAVEHFFFFILLLSSSTNVILSIWAAAVRYYSFFTILFSVFAVSIISFTQTIACCCSSSISSFVPLLSSYFLYFSFVPPLHPCAPVHILK